MDRILEKHKITKTITYEKDIDFFEIEKIAEELKLEDNDELFKAIDLLENNIINSHLEKHNLFQNEDGSKLYSKKAAYYILHKIDKSFFSRPGTL